MLRKLVKQLPLSSMWYKNYVLTRENKLANEQLRESVKLLEQQYQLLLAVNNFGEQEEQDFVVSLTSYGARVETVHLTIMSLLCQTIRPNNIYLWLAQEEFCEDTIPQELVKLKAFGLKIGFCTDIRSYKKLIPTLKLNLNKHVITFDDDVLYPSDQIEKLLAASKVNPESVICHVAHIIGRNKETSEISPYHTWKRDNDINTPSAKVFPVGVGGVFYPKEAFDNDVLNEQLFTEICPHADDVWFKLLALKNGTLARMVEQPTPYRALVHIPTTQDVSLWQLNTEKNDIQIANVIRYFGIEV